MRRKSKLKRYYMEDDEINEVVSKVFLDGYCKRQDDEVFSGYVDGDLTELYCNYGNMVFVLRVDEVPRSYKWTQKILNRLHGTTDIRYNKGIEEYSDNSYIMLSEKKFDKVTINLIKKQ